MDKTTAYGFGIPAILFAALSLAAVIQTYLDREIVPKLMAYQKKLKEKHKK